MAISSSLPLSFVTSFITLLLFLFPSPTTPYTPLSSSSLLSIPSPGSSFDIHTGSLLAPILQPRVSGTAGSTTVLNHFATFFRTELPEWTLQFQNSTSTTPRSHGQEVPFINMIAIRDPPGTTPGEVGRLTLVAHYDSKLTPIGFIGATDSAAPCAMLMHAARSIDDALTAKWASMSTSSSDNELDNLLTEHQGIQIIFMDGEEAVLSWTDTDSLYGARSLAQEWESTPHAALSTYKTPLSAISLFVLLDLLGSKSPTVPSYYKTTHWAYQHMADLEKRMRDLGSFESSPSYNKPPKTKIGIPEPLFLPDSSHPSSKPYLGGLIGDDHVPFNARGIETLHIIPSPFPRVWHEMDDDGEHLDLPTVRDWARLVAAFAGEWMDLDGYFPKVAEGGADGGGGGGSETGKEKRGKGKRRREKTEL